MPREPYPGYDKEERRYYRRISILMVCALGLMAFLASYAIATTPLNPLVEYGYCGAPARDAKGQIIRRADVLRAFQKAHPCPSTGLRAGSCPGYARDHRIPLSCGGCDSVSNLQWLKTADWKAKSLWERKIYAATPPHPDTSSCVNVIVP